MTAPTVSVPLPKELIARIDDEVGTEGRVDFIEQCARSGLRDLKLNALLSGDDENLDKEEGRDAIATQTHAPQLLPQWEERPSIGNPPPPIKKNKG